ncbi:hypothetical protein BU045_12605, partial [Staphylococcus simulans]
MTVIKIKNLNFSYSDKVIFKDANFEFTEGSINRIEGSNGVGKTTLFHILSGCLKGDVEISPRVNFEFITTEFLPFDELTGKEITLLFFALNNRPKNTVNSYIAYFKNLNLEYVLKNRYKNMSLGEKQKLNILISFVNNSKIILLDEPFNALDRNSKRALSELLVALSVEYQRTIIY